jgi:hypothetical protein
VVLHFFYIVVDHLNVLFYLVLSKNEHGLVGIG